MAKKIDIGGELHSVATDHKVADASEIKDISKGNKSQTAFNNDVNRHEVEIHGTGGIESRLTDVEQIEQIVLEGGEVQIAQGSDFTNPDATKRAKVPTVGAIVDGLNDGIYDVSKRNPTSGPNSDGKFTLDYILDNANTLIPTGWRHGGMTISFVHTSDNKYVQYRLMSDSFNTTPANWQGVDDEPTVGSDNLVKSGGIEEAIRNLIKGIGNLNTGSPDYNPLISDANDAELNKIYSINKANYVANMPSDGQGVLLTMSYSKNATICICQIFISAVTFEFYWRIKWSSWGSWKGTDTINEKLAEGYIYKGIATDSTNPGTPKGKVFYIATAEGIYTNFNNLDVPQGINLLKYDGSAWSHELVYGVDNTPTEGNYNLVRSSGVAFAIKNMLSGIGDYSTGAPDYNPLITDANDAEVNKIYFIQKANYVAHLPSDGQGNLFTFSYANNAIYGLCQIFISAATLELYWRVKWGNNWSDWKGTDSFALLAKTILTNNNKINANYHPFTDANDAPNNTIWCIQAYNVVSNMPTSDQQGLLITLQSDSSNAAIGKLQICMNSDGELYYRTTWGGSYRNWKRLDFPEGSEKIQKNLEDLNYNIINSAHGTLVDYTECVDNKYLNANGSYGESNEFMVSNYIPVNTNVRLYFTNCGNNVVCVYDKNKNYLSYTTIPNLSGVEIINPNWAYVRFNVVKAYIPNGLFVSYNENDHLYGLAYGQKGYPHNVIIDFDQSARNAVLNEINITLGTTYATLKTALDYASTVANANKIVNILVPAGEYNVFSDIDLSQQSSDFKGLIVPNYVNIIGIGAAKDTILKAELPVDMTGYAFSRGNVSTLNLWRNNNLKNLTIIGSNMRYAVHNDTATGTAGYVEDAQEVFENCIFIGKQTDVAVNVDSSFGSGMRNGAYLKFKNCKFIIESVATESTGVTFATNFHNTANSFKTITWRFENCLFSSGYKNFAMYVTNYSGVKNGVIILNGCKIDKRICAASQTGSRNSDYVYYGSGSVFTDTRKFYTNGVDLVDEDTEMLL